MRVLHIDTERGWRGGERQSLWLAAELARRGHVSIMAARPGEPLARRAPAEVELLPCAPAFEGDPRTVLTLRGALRSMHIDLVHAHTAHAAGFGALATLGTDVPLVVARRVDFRLRRNVASRWKYGRAAAFIAVSRAVAEILVEDGVDRAKVVVVADGTDIHRCIEPASPETLLSLGVQQQAPLVVQVAHLVPHKDPLNFVRAVATARTRIPSLQALLVGDGPLRGEVESAVRKLGLTDTLHITGYRTDADA